ncbi:MAG: NAD-dependent epimerase/dehydratase family protein [Muribaculaceae bacterium]|nr:NAD-dependent epimerase/dehydratase family protein [Muribaculaceae bacterium]
MKNIFLTGATGVMGMKGMQEILGLRDKGENLLLTVLARPGKRNEKKLQPFIDRGVKVIWGDLLDPIVIERGVRDADVVLHVGGMVSPAADWEPEKTYRVNTESMRLIVEAAKKREATECGERRVSVRVVYIGSVAQYGNRPYPHQWGRSGDPICSATFDKYALSKIEAERILA